MKQLQLFIASSTLIILFFGCKDAKESNNAESPNPSVSIQSNDRVTDGDTIRINSEGLWSAFEGELGFIEIYDKQNQLVGTSIMRSSDGNWMVSGPAKFIAVLSYSTNETQSGTLKFINHTVRDTDSVKHFSVPVTLEASDKTLGASMGDLMCYASKTTSGIEQSKYNYQFKKFVIGENQIVEGYFINSPYGTDGSRGHFVGSLENGALNGTETLLAEGSIYKEDRSYAFNDNEIKLGYQNVDGNPATLSKMSCDEFDRLMKEYQNSIVSSRINSTDRSRLKKIKELKTLGFDEALLNEVQFMEVQFDLDGNYNTEEYLLYILDPSLCGSGGCTLFVVDGNQNLISQTSVTKLPIYVPVTLIDDAKSEETTWKDLVVWSDGSYRRLTNSGKGYVSNASMAPAIKPIEVEMHPENYKLLLNYLD